MLIVDSQVHIWAANTAERPWRLPQGALTPQRAHRDPPLSAEHLLREMKTAGVDRVVLVPPSWEGDRNDVALAAARRYPDKFAVVGRLDVSTDDAKQQIAGWLNQPGMLGLKLTFHSPLLERPLLEGRVDWVWAAAEKAGVPIMVLVPFSLVHVIERIAEKHPRLKLVLDHLCVIGDKKDDEAFDQFHKTLALARFPNVAAKASSMPFYSTEPYPYRSLHRYIRQAYDAFGARRLFWGTDLSRLGCTYRQAVTMFTEEMPWLSEEDKEWIMGRGVCEWMGWRLP